MVSRRDYTGVNTVSKTRKLPDGSTERIIYFYRRACGTLLGRSDEGMTKDQAIEVVRLWEAEATRSGPTAGTINDVFARYRASSHHLNRADKRATSTGWR